MIRIAASDSSAADKASADLVCNGSNDRTVVQKGWGRPNEQVQMLDGIYYVDMGSNGVDGNPYLYPGAGTVITGGPGVILQATNGICRIQVQQPNVTISGITFKGWIHLQRYVDNITITDCTFDCTLDGETYLDWGPRGGCTGVIQSWAKPGTTQSGTTIQRVTIIQSYHHAIGFHIAGAEQGATHQNILIEDVTIISPGSGLIEKGTKDWSCGIDWDAGNLRNVTVRRVKINDSWQSAFHTDGSWDAHSQSIDNLVFEDCLAVDAGKRAGTIPNEIYESGFYLQSGTLKNCKTTRCRCGILAGNEVANSLVIEGHIDEGSQYALAIEVGGAGAQVLDFTSIGATRRALQMVGSNVKITGFRIQQFAGKGAPVMLGLNERLVYVDAPSHVRDLPRYRGFTYNVTGTLDFLCDNITQLSDLIEVHPGSRIDMSRVHLSHLDSAPVVTPDPVVIVTPPRTEPLPVVPLIDDEPAVPVAPVEVTPVTPPTTGASFTITPATPHVGDQVRFRVTPATGKTIQSTWWTFDADKHHDTWNSRERNPSFFYAVKGTFSPLVTITYTDGTTETVKRAGGVVIS